MNKFKTCCETFHAAVENHIITCTKEDEWTQEITELDGWYIRKRAYDSWYGYWGVGDKFVYCPWCSQPAPPKHIIKEIKDSMEMRLKMREIYATGVVKNE